MVVAQFLADSYFFVFSLNSLIDSKSYIHIRVCMRVCVHTCGLCVHT